MIIEEGYLISSIHLASGKVLNSKLFFKNGKFNFYTIENDHIKLFLKSKIVEDGEDYIEEIFLGIVSLENVEFLETKEIESLSEEILEILGIDTIDENTNQYR